MSVSLKVVARRRVYCTTITLKTKILSLPKSTTLLSSHKMTNYKFNLLNLNNKLHSSISTMNKSMHSPISQKVLSSQKTASHNQIIPHLSIKHIDNNN